MPEPAPQPAPEPEASSNDGPGPGDPAPDGQSQDESIGLGTIGASGASDRPCDAVADRPAPECAAGEPLPAALGREVERFLYRTAGANSYTFSESADITHARDIEPRLLGRTGERIVVRVAYRHRRSGYRDTRGCGSPDRPCPVAPSGEGTHCIELAFVPDGARWKLDPPSCVPGLGRVDFRPRPVRAD